MKLGDWVLIALGVLYIVYPNVFRRGMWTKTSLLQRHLSPRGYVLVIRLLGLASIAVGLSDYLFSLRH